jgi:AICAR transformylase/IMP cyclohydrolase PurH
VTTLRYGENPHQSAALYVPRRSAVVGLPQAEQIQGKELVQQLQRRQCRAGTGGGIRGDKPTVVIVKHANPCGVASADTLLDAWQAALACDSVSAFGGIVAVNQPLDGPTANAICEIFTEVVVAPGADAAAREAFARKKNLRLLLSTNCPMPRAPACHRADRRRPAGSGSRQRQDQRQRPQGGDAARTHRAGTRRMPVCLDRGQARQVQRHRLCQGWRHRRHRRGPDEPPRQQRIAAAKAQEAARPTAGAKPARSAPPSLLTPSSPSPMA